MSNLNGAVNNNWCCTLWAGISGADFSSFNICIWCEVAAINNIARMAILLICTSYPRRTRSNSWICVHSNSRFLCILWSDVTLYKCGKLCKICIFKDAKFMYAAKVFLETLEINFAITWHQDANRLVICHQHHIFQCVRSCVSPTKL